MTIIKSRVIPHPLWSSTRLQPSGLQVDYPCETSGRELDCSWVLGTCWRERGFRGGLKTREKGPPRTPNIGENKTISGKMIARGSQALETGRATRAEPRAIRRTPRACYFLLGPFFFFCAAFWLDPTWNFGLKWLVEFVCNFTREPLKSRWWTEIYSEYESIYSLL